MVVDRKAGDRSCMRRRLRRNLLSSTPPVAARRILEHSPAGVVRGELNGFRTTEMQAMNG